MPSPGLKTRRSPPKLRAFMKPATVGFVRKLRTKLLPPPAPPIKRMSKKEKVRMGKKFYGRMRRRKLLPTVPKNLMDVELNVPQYRTKGYEFIARCGSLIKVVKGIDVSHLRHTSAKGGYKSLYSRSLKENHDLMISLLKNPKSRSWTSLGFCSKILYFNRNKKSFLQYTSMLEWMYYGSKHWRAKYSESDSDSLYEYNPDYSLY